MQVLIVGGGRTGSELANLLLQEGHGVTVIEQRADLIPRLHKEIGKAVVMQGDGCEPTVLEQANIRKANVVAAVTGHDEDNLVICLLARQEFGVRRTVARVNNPKNEWLFTPEMGVDVSVSQAHIMTALMREEMASLEMVVLLRLQRGDTVLVEDILQPSSRSVGKPLSALAFPETAVVVALVRHDEIIIPRGNVVLEAGDRVIALTRAADRARVAAILA